MRILEKLCKQDKPVFVDTNIPVEVLAEISVKRFFERPDKEKQFLYQLLLQEENSVEAIENFRECLKRVNSEEIYHNFLNSGFNVLMIDEERKVDETLSLVEDAFKLKI